MGRLLLASLILLPALVGLTGFGLDRAYQQSLLAAEKSRLTSQVYLLLAAADVNDGQVYLPKAFTEPQLSQPGSGLYGFVHADHDNQLDTDKEYWRSASAQWIAPQQLGLDQPTHLPGAVIEFTHSDGDYFHLHYRIRWEQETGGELPLVFSIYQSMTGYRQQLEGYRSVLVFWLSVVTAASVLMQCGLLVWGLRPLQRLAHAIAALTRGEIGAIKGVFPMELRGLQQNLNALLESEKHQRSRYRNTLADLAHSIKTPLAVINGEINHAAPDGLLIKEQVGRIGDIVGRQLQRASAGDSGFLMAIDPSNAIERLISSLGKLYPAVHFNFTACAYRVRIDEKDLFEILGNTLENACKYGASQVSVSVQPEQHRGREFIALSIADDGPGIAKEARTTLLTRGQRLDELQSGQGLGLALVQDIVVAYGGELRLDDSSLGGLVIKILLPEINASSQGGQ